MLLQNTQYLVRLCLVIGLCADGANGNDGPSQKHQLSSSKWSSGADHFSARGSEPTSNVNTHKEAARAGSVPSAYGTFFQSPTGEGEGGSNIVGGGIHRGALAAHSSYRDFRVHL